jgi:hypothetical protein
MIPTDRPTVAEVAPAVSIYYAMPMRGTGGSLHIVLDDLNCEQQFIDWCVKENAELGHWCAADDRFLTGASDVPGYWLGRILQLLSKSQRARVGRAGYAPGWDHQRTATMADFLDAFEPLWRWLNGT